MSGYFDKKLSSNGRHSGVKSSPGGTFKTQKQIVQKFESESEEGIQVMQMDILNEIT